MGILDGVRRSVMPASFLRTPGLTAANLQRFYHGEKSGPLSLRRRLAGDAWSSVLCRRPETEASSSTPPFNTAKRFISTNDPPAPRLILNRRHYSSHLQKLPYLSGLRRNRQSCQHQQPYHVTAVTMTDPEPSSMPLPLAQRIPPGAWDSHMHVVDPDTYPLGPEAVYRPSTFTLEQALAFEASVGIRNIVLVQPSIYGNDNTCTLDALRELGPERGRAVVQFDPATTSTEQLQEWHRLGVRGVRLNIQSYEREIDGEGLSRALHQCANAVRDLGWAVQVYVPMPLIVLLEHIVPSLNVRFCIDHMGHPILKGHSSSNPYDLTGFSSLVRILQTSNTYVKLSAPYRTSLVHDYSDTDPIAKELIRLIGTSRLVFATDWPHTRYEGLDIQPWMETVLKWCGNDEFLRERLFRGNAEDLWDVTRS